MTYTPRMSRCEKHGTEREWPENCRECDQEKRDAFLQEQERRETVLLTAGFSAPMATGGMFGVEFTTCLTCGAAVPLLAYTEGQTAPIDAHIAWHRTHESPAQPEG